MSKGNETWGQIKWPVKAIVPVNLKDNQPESPMLCSEDGMFVLCKTKTAGEVKQLAELLNWLNDLTQNQEASLSEKNILIADLEKIKVKYFELLKSMEAQRDAVNERQETEKLSPGAEMIRTTGTADFAYSGEDGKFRRGPEPSPEDGR